MAGLRKKGGSGFAVARILKQAVPANAG